ncbi:hypothetical protein FHG87_015547 [Trinorchestia longiramus]|nr:hypothetical protein FHG87_015547 [Trinorchestia longiramus]
MPRSTQHSQSVARGSSTPPGGISVSLKTLQFFMILTLVVQSASSLTPDHLGSQIYDESRRLWDLDFPALSQRWASELLPRQRYSPLSPKQRYSSLSPKQRFYPLSGRAVGERDSELFRKGDLGRTFYEETNATADNYEEVLSRQKRLFLEFPDKSRLILVVVLVIPKANYNFGGGVLALVIKYTFVIQLPNQMVSYIGMRESEHHHYHHHIPYDPNAPVPAPAPPAPAPAPPAPAPAPPAPAPAPPAYASATPAATTPRTPSFAIYQVPQQAPASPPAPPPSPSASSYAKSVDAQRKAGFQTLEATMDA